MKLFYKAGACSLATHIVLHELDLPFEIESVDTSEKTTASGRDFLQINPDGYVPAVELADGNVLTEGAAILQYLADTHPDAGLAPAPGSWERTQLHRHLNFISAELHKSFGPLFAKPALEGAARDAAVEKIGTKIGHFERILADGREFVTGKTFSVADAYLFTVLNWTNFVGVSLEGHPHAKAFVERIAARPATRAALTAEGLLQAA
ncbi:glutathione transferase GstA [Stappia sp.]|jgi:glutathione S-transferase|uniref:glutathione transferase GstA n=1 Tax=Stappia sp. TaxID=1870903 RepID=UPI003D1136DD